MCYKDFGFVAERLAGFFQNAFDLLFCGLDRRIHTSLFSSYVLYLLLSNAQVGFAQDKCLGLDQAFGYAQCFNCNHLVFHPSSFLNP